MRNDRISCLPDSLLSHILSFLPTQDVVATSVLSKRWRPMWRFNTTLDFNYQGHKQKKEQHLRFVEFVCKILLSRDVLQPIKRFRFECDSSYICSSNVNIWVNRAIQHQVEHLDIGIHGSKVFNICLSSSVFTCQTIVILKLSGRALKVNAFNSVSLPSLKLLHLDHVRFPNRGFLAKLLSGCPVLDNLLLSFISYTCGNSYKDCCKTLPKLISADVDCFDVVGKALHMAQFLRMRIRQKVWPNVIFTFPNLVHFELVVEHYRWKGIAEILQNSPQIQILVIIKKKPATSSHTMGNFVRAKRIPSYLRKCQMEGFEGKECELLFAKYIMENATSLSTMKISASDHASDSSYSDAKSQMLKELSSYKRISLECQLLFE